MKQNWPRHALISSYRLSCTNARVASNHSLSKTIYSGSQSYYWAEYMIALVQFVYSVASRRPLVATHMLAAGWHQGCTVHEVSKSTSIPGVYATNVNKEDVLQYMVRTYQAPRFVPSTDIRNTLRSTPVGVDPFFKSPNLATISTCAPPFFRWTSS